MQRMVKHKVEEYNLQLTKQWSRALHKYQKVPLFSALIRRIANRALDLIYTEYLKANKALTKARDYLGPYNCQVGQQ